MFRKSTSGHTGLCGSGRALEYLGHQAAKTPASLFEFAHIYTVQDEASTLNGRKLFRPKAIKSGLTHKNVGWCHRDTICRECSRLLIIEFDDIVAVGICEGKSTNLLGFERRGGDDAELTCENRKHYIRMVLRLSEGRI